ncbi:hypothetical protein DFH06DRAFT_1141870 [Mycena polygramma]|nr:hypothetical protein DFH06DRAFT_1141870 [Mycena polygramma]
MSTTWLPPSPTHSGIRATHIVFVPPASPAPAQDSSQAMAHASHDPRRISTALRHPYRLCPSSAIAPSRPRRWQALQLPGSAKVVELGATYNTSKTRVPAAARHVLHTAPSFRYTGYVPPPASSADGLKLHSLPHNARASPRLLLAALLAQDGRGGRATVRNSYDGGEWVTLATPSLVPRSFSLPASPASHMRIGRTPAPPACPSRLPVNGTPQDFVSNGSRTTVWSVEEGRSVKFASMHAASEYRMPCCVLLLRPRRCTIEDEVALTQEGRQGYIPDTPLISRLSPLFCAAADWASACPRHSQPPFEAQSWLLDLRIPALRRGGAEQHEDDSPRSGALGGVGNILVKSAGSIPVFTARTGDP